MGMKTYMIVTPEFEVRIPILDDGTGPWEWNADVIEVEAENKKDAIALGVQLMLKEYWKYKYVRDQRSDGCSPYTGVKAYLQEEDSE